MPILHIAANDVYNSLYLQKDLEKVLTIEDVAADENTNAFIPAEKLDHNIGIFHTAKWLRFDVENNSDFHAHQGRITVESEFGKGTTFSITLPVVEFRVA